MARFWSSKSQQNQPNSEKSWLETHVGFVVDFNDVFYGSGDLQTLENRCFVYRKHIFSEKAPIDFKLDVEA